MTSLLIYEAYGYVGDLVAWEPVSRGLKPILGGRDGEELVAQAEELGCRMRKFDLSARSAIAEELEDVDCVLNCAGPFSNTAEVLLGGCLQSEADYVDITGEIPVTREVGSPFFLWHTYQTRWGEQSN